jgi:sugar diacid utilization regulator
VTNADFAAVLERLLQRVEAIGDAMVERYRAEIVDYATADDALLDDVRTVSVDNARLLLVDLQRGTLPGPEEFQATATAAARRVHQGIPLEAFLHAFRLWTRILWEQVLEEARTDRPGEREAALQIAGGLMTHVDLVSSAGALAYLEEVQGIWSDREILRRDLLELLLAGGDPEAARRHAASLAIDLADDYAVIVVRARDRPADDLMPATLQARTVLRRVVDAARHALARAGAPALVGVRHGEVVALSPAADRDEYAQVRQRCDALARSVAGVGFAVGLGGWHRGLAHIALSFSESREAALASARAEPGTAMAFDDIVITHLLRTSTDAHRVLGELLAPVVAYDADREAGLLATLRTYITSGFSPTRAAHELIVHPNTVLYRLKRIRDLTGRDPHEPDDLVLLALALKHLDEP